MEQKTTKRKNAITKEQIKIKTKIVNMGNKNIGTREQKWLKKGNKASAKKNAPIFFRERKKSSKLRTNLYNVGIN
jgi:beta-lactamase class D